jgi:AraC family transcriptional regulator
MREVSALSAMSSMMTIRVDDALGSIIPPRPNPSRGLAASASERVEHLVMQAMAHCDSNREAVRVCLRKALTFLRGEREEFGISAPLRQSTLRRGGLAAWRAKRALRYVEGNLGSRMAVRDMADVAALSTSHFSRAFKQSFGCSPIAYVMTRRIERAKLMMTSTREKLLAIALACGFADQPHFNRHFARLVGMSPGLWRRMSRRTSG